MGEEQDKAAAVVLKNKFMKKEVFLKKQDGKIYFVCVLVIFFVLVFFLIYMAKI